MGSHLLDLYGYGTHIRIGLKAFSNMGTLFGLVVELEVELEFLFKAQGSGS
jgi:hypothetical protein